MTRMLVLAALLTVGCDDTPDEPAEVSVDAAPMSDAGADVDALPAMCDPRDWRWVTVDGAQRPASAAMVTAVDDGYIALDGAEGPVEIAYPPIAGALALPAVGEGVTLMVGGCTGEPRAQYARLTTPGGALWWEGGGLDCRWPADRRLRLEDDPSAAPCHFVPPGSTAAGELNTPGAVAVTADAAASVGHGETQGVQIDGVGYRVVVPIAMQITPLGDCADCPDRVGSAYVGRMAE